MQENKGSKVNIEYMPIERALRIIEDRLQIFEAQRWYGTVEVKIEDGQIRQIDTKPIIRDR